MSSRLPIRGFGGGPGGNGRLEHRRESVTTSPATAIAPAAAFANVGASHFTTV